MTSRDMNIKIFTLATKRSELGEGRFKTQDYIDVCAKIYSTKKMSQKSGHKHLSWNDLVKKVEDDVWLFSLWKSDALVA